MTPSRTPRFSFILVFQFCLSIPVSVVEWLSPSRQIRDLEIWLDGGREWEFRSIGLNQQHSELPHPPHGIYLFVWFSLILSLDFPFSDSVLLRTISPVDGRFGSAGVRYEKRGGNIQRKLRYTYTVVVAVKNRNIWLSPWSFWVFILSNIKKMTTNSFSRRLWILLIIRLSDENGYDRRRSSQEVMGRFKGNKQRSRKKRGEREEKRRPRDGREAVVFSCHGMLCWLPAGPGGCSVAGRDQTGTQRLFSLSFPVSKADHSKARQYSRPVVVVSFFGWPKRRPSALSSSFFVVQILNWNSRLFIILTLLSADIAPLFWPRFDWWPIDFRPKQREFRWPLNILRDEEEDPPGV